MANAVEVGSLIDRDPAIRGGRPKIAGTGVTVMTVAGWYKLRLAPEEIAAEYGHLSLAQIHAALAYYHANSDEIEADLAGQADFGHGKRVPDLRVFPALRHLPGNREQRHAHREKD